MLDFWRRLIGKRDFYAGGLMVLLGLFAAWNGPEYGLGTLMELGPGFLPTALGVILVILGILIAGAATVGPDGEADDGMPTDPQWWGWGCILAGPIAFIVFGKLGGMMPAAFTCVFFSALGDRTATLKSALTLAAVITVFGVGLFSYLLGIPMPVLKWGGL